MNIFISYSRANHVMANLLGYILTNKGFNCLIDHKIEPGRSFDKEIEDMIQKSDIILILLTRSSLSSQWVNQEIGYARALKKQIWPIAMENDIDPKGIIFSTQSYNLINWSEPYHSIDLLVEALHKNIAGNDDLFLDFGFDRVLQGREARTRFLVYRLKELKKLLASEKDRKIILNQSAFSIFAASNDPMYVNAGNHSPELIKLMLEERSCLDELARMPNCSLKLILYPVRSYEPKYLAVRFQHLLKWLNEIKDISTVDYVYAPYPVPNRLIVVDEFCLEGYKLHNHPGYEMSLIKYQKDYIKKVQAEFEFVFNWSAMGKEDTIRRIEEKSKELNC